MSITQLLQQAQANPDSAIADSLRAQIEAWEWDQELKDQKIDMPWRPLASIPKTRVETWKELAWETFVKGRDTTIQWLKWIWASIWELATGWLIDFWPEGRTSFAREVIRTAWGLWKIIETPFAWAAWSVIPEIQAAANLIPDEIKQTFAGIWEKFDSLEPGTKTLITDLFDALNLIPLAWQIKAWLAKTAAEWIDAAISSTKKIEKVADVWKAWALWEAVVWSTLKLNRTDIDKFKKFSWWQSPSRFLLDKDLARWSKETIADASWAFARNKYDELNTAVAWIKWTHQNAKFNQAFDALIDNVDWVPGLEEKLADLIALKKKHDTEWLELSEVLTLKRKIDQDADIFTLAWDVKSAKSKEWLANIRQNVKEFIEDEAAKSNIDVKDLSRDIQLSNEIKRWLAKIINREESANLFSLMDWIITFWAASWAWIPWAIAAFTIKKVADNPSFRNALARQLNSLDEGTKIKLLRKNLKFTPLEINSIQDAIKKAETEWWAAITDEEGAELPQIPEEFLE